MLRWVVNIVVLLAICGLAIGTSVWRRQTAHTEALNNEAIIALRQFEQVIRLKAATGDTTLNSRGWPIAVDPTWFREGLPRNPLLTGQNPWLEIASPDDAELQHPPVRMAIDETVAGFWYNPALGIVRIRVPVMLSDEDATTLYNELNGCQLTSIFDEEHLPKPVKVSRKGQAEAQQEQQTRQAAVPTH